MNEIKISEIEIGDNRRVVDIKKVKELAKGIKDVGLINPITVSKVDGGYKLVAGLHRLKAFQELGRDFIKVNVMEGNELELELIEIDENLLRNEIDYLERGSYFHRRDEILKALGRRASRGDNRHTSRPPDSGHLEKLKTTKDLAKEMNVSETKYYEEIGIAKRTTPASKEAIKRAGLTKSEAIVISKKKPEEQNEIFSGIDLKEDSAPEKIKEVIKESGIEEQVKNKNERKNESSKKAVSKPKRDIREEMIKREASLSDEDRKKAHEGMTTENFKSYLENIRYTLQQMKDLDMNEEIKNSKEKLTKLLEEF